MGDGRAVACLSMGAQSAFNAPKEGLLGIALKGYYDGSGTVGDSRFMTLAGYVGTPEAWDDFEPLWVNVLGQHGLDYLHMREMTAFESTWAKDHEWTRQKLNSVVQHLQNHCLGDIGWRRFKNAFFGVACSIDLDDWARAKLERPRLKDPASICVDVVVYNSLRGLPEDEDRPPLYKRGDIEMWFDKGEPFYGRVDRYWRRRQRSNLLDLVVALNKADDMRKVPGLQAADFLSWNVHKARTTGEFWYDLVGSMSAPADVVVVGYEALITGYNGIELS